MLYKTFKMKKKKYTQDKPNVNANQDMQDVYVKKLAKMIECKTVSGENADEKEFEKFRDVLKQNFPLIYQNAELLNFDGCLVYKIKGKTNRNIILMSHHDVVEAKGEWVAEPFGAEVKNGVMFGRGTIDTKTPFFAEMQALEELLQEGFVPEVNVYIASSNNEEICGDGIVKAVEYFEQNDIHFEIVLDEGGAIMDKMVPGVKEKCALIAVHEKSRHTFECVAVKNDDISKGHAGLTGLSDNPIERMTQFINEINNLKLKTALYPEVKAMFENCAPNMSFGYRFLFSNLNIFEKPLLKLLPKINDQVKNMLSTTLAFTNINSYGGSEQVRATEVKATMFVRCVRDYDLKRDMQIIEKIAKKYAITLNTKIVDYCKPADFYSQSFAYIKQVLNKNFPNVVVAPFLLTAGTDARRLTDVADNIFRFAPINLSKEQFATVHSANENISVSSIGEAVCFYKEFVKNYQ